MKRSLRDYLFTLLIAIVIFTVAAFFLISYAEGLMGDVIENVQNVDRENPTQQAQTGEQGSTSGAPSENPQPAQPTDNILTFLVLGIDEQRGNADAIFLVGINATKKQMTVSLIPSNTLVADASTGLGALYASHGIGSVQSFVAEETGITPDFYAVFTMDGFSNMIDLLGGISYNVPQTMYYFDPTQNLMINLKAGTQNLTGDQALQLLAFCGYKDGAAAREDVQIAFAKAFCRAFLKPENIANSRNVMDNVAYHVNTNFTAADFEKYAEWIFAADSYSLAFQRIPGAGGSNGMYAISSSRSASLYEAYKK